MDTAKPFTSLIALLRHPRNLDEAAVNDSVRRAFPPHSSDALPPSVRHVPGKPLFAVSVAGLPLGVIDVDQPYFKDIARAADATRELQARLAIQQHTAWLAIDVMRDRPASLRPIIFSILGKLLAALLNEDPLALARTPDDKIVGYDPCFRNLLTSGNTAKIFQLGAPDQIIGTPPRDAELAAATEQAKARWPEFLTAFSKRAPGHGFSVKKAFEENGIIEHMWVEVRQIAGHTIHGLLQNDPRNIPSLQLGDPVSLNIDEIEDWMFTRGRETVGGFQIPILQRRQPS